ncbi:hypothetical protein, partial [Caballeronia calidae]|uniref:hypothetical protein n=1 Tax=Caballeronia calidae TaxID=1777139 RepID=UPI001E5701D3
LSFCDSSIASEGGRRERRRRGSCVPERHSARPQSREHTNGFCANTCPSDLSVHSQAHLDAIADSLTIVVDPRMRFMLPSRCLLNAPSRKQTKH